MFTVKSQESNNLAFWLSQKYGQLKVIKSNILLNI